jgi:serine O-acetyltransferase
MEHLLHTQIGGTIPERLHLPHPFGIITGTTAKIGEDVTLMQFCLLGGKDPWSQDDSLEETYPTLQEGVYVSAGAKILGSVTVGAWSIIGANAVVTQDIPAFATVVGANRILRVVEGGASPVRRYLESRKESPCPKQDVGHVTSIRSDSLK